jgi:septum formation protein
MSESSAYPNIFASIYLASQSPRRRELLNQIGVAHELLPADADEDVEALEAHLPGESPDTYVTRVCAAKAHAACQRLRQRCLAPLPILTADTTVAVDNEILGKPADAADAARMLALMSGRRHRVLTAVALALPSSGTTLESEPAAILTSISVSMVQIATLTRAAIDRYIASGEPFGKAGAYGIQGLAGTFIARIEGSYSGIMGLPLYETSVLLDTARIARRP